MILPDLLKKSIVLSIFIYGVYNLTVTARDIIDLSQKEKELNNKIENLSSEKTNLERKLEILNSDEFVEKEARTKLNMKKEGEEIYIVPVSSKTLSNESDDSKMKEKSNLELWLEVLF